MPSNVIDLATHMAESQALAHAAAVIDADEARAHEQRLSVQPEPRGRADVDALIARFCADAALARRTDELRQVVERLSPIDRARIVEAHRERFGDAAVASAFGTGAAAIRPRPRKRRRRA